MDVCIPYNNKNWNLTSISALRKRNLVYLLLSTVKNKIKVLKKKSMNLEVWVTSYEYSETFKTWTVVGICSVLSHEGSMHEKIVLLVKLGFFNEQINIRNV